MGIGSDTHLMSAGSTRMRMYPSMLMPLVMHVLMAALSSNSGSGGSGLVLLRPDGGDGAAMLALHVEVRHYGAALLPEHLLQIHLAVLAVKHLHQGGNLLESYSYAFIRRIYSSSTGYMRW